MELDLWWWSIVAAVMLGTYFLVFDFLRKINECYYVNGLGKKQINSLPPGDMGLPLIGNMWSFIRAFKSQEPESFINNLKKRYGETGIYKTSLFWQPCIIVCRPELCRKTLADDEKFKYGYNIPSIILGEKPFNFLSSSGRKRFRRITTSGINGEALSTYLGIIEDIVMNTAEKWTKTKQPIQFVSEMNKISFRVITTIFLGSTAVDSVIASLEKDYACLFQGLFCTPANIPGFAFHRALKARKRLVKTIKAILAERRESYEPISTKKGLIDLIKEGEDEEGRKMDEEHVLITLLVFLLAGHETVSRATVWATIYLHDRPQLLQKAKEEQEEIIKRRPSSFQKGLTISEIKQMKYLSKVIDETLRISTNAFALLREAKEDTTINGYFIPKGWKVLVWQSAVHLDPEIYSNPKEFLPSRWDNQIKHKAGTFFPFGAGSTSCPGADLAKLLINTFLHNFLLNYKLEQLNPGGPINYLPSPVPADNCPAKIIKLH